LNEFKRFRNGEVLNKPLWIALADVFERYEMDETPFLELAEGMRWDIEKNRYQTLEETEHYSYYVASTSSFFISSILR
jgi:phytoene synthase